MRRADPTWVLCCFMVCLAYVLAAWARRPDPAPMTVTVSVTRAADVRPTLQSLGLPPLEVRR